MTVTLPFRKTKTASQRHGMKELGKAAQCFLSTTVRCGRQTRCLALGWHLNAVLVPRETRLVKGQFRDLIDGKMADCAVTELPSVQGLLWFRHLEEDTSMARAKA